jgi:hypothetical protein
MTAFGGKAAIRPCAKLKSPLNGAANLGCKPLVRRAYFEANSVFWLKHIIGAGFSAKFVCLAPKAEVA